ncbi:lysin A [Gordonia phage OtterstedtS21]|uniref:Lysin A n=4 Tax=Lambovirus TaxID=2843412 RepID=A0A9E7QR14_9CAUD|nr:endolysin [Gordonia phage Gibbin]YP_009852688.1 endolysin [Gordonia phage Sadboi]QFG08175.1 lysin A [Gordonia phage GretelLyn]UVT31199.1 lysin A [Gordonia phage OtterstedtS21]QFG10578.1 lysin A [Gordonia phage Gibbin]QFG14687.1 lysin A [Gordonia phage Sadboi]
MGDVVWLEKAFRNAGLPIEVFPGAYQRGHGDLIGDKPFMHHTGSFNETANGIANHPSLGLCSQLFLKKGKFTLCGVGVAYHAGMGSGFGLPTNNGNWHSIGIEAAHDGRAKWDTYHLNNYLEGIRVINRHRGKPLNDVVAHKEYGAIQGKWDPGNLDMKWVRQVLLEEKKPAQAVVINMIELEAKENPWVGKRLAKPGAEGEMKVGHKLQGRLVEYENAHIYFHPSCGAHAIPHGGLFEAYANFGFEKGPLGYPVRDFTKLPEGAVMAFQGAVLYKKDGKDAQYVKGVIGQRWAKEGYEKGPLGWATSLEIPNGTGGVIQYFENGSLEWDPSGAVEKIGQFAVRDLSIVNEKTGLPLAVDAVNLSTAA